MLQPTKDNPHFKVPPQTATHKFIGHRSSKKSGSKHSQNSAVSHSKNVSREERDHVPNEPDEFLQRSVAPVSGAARERKENAVVNSESNSLSSGGKLTAFS